MPSHPSYYRKTPEDHRCLAPDCELLIPPTWKHGRPKLYCDAVCQRCYYLYWRSRMVSARLENREDINFKYPLKSRNFSMTCDECGGPNPQWQRFCCRACLHRYHMRLFRERRKDPLKFAKNNPTLPEEAKVQGRLTQHEYGMMTLKRYRKKLAEYYGSEDYIGELAIKTKEKARLSVVRRLAEKALKWAEENPGPHPDSDFWKL